MATSSLNLGDHWDRFISKQVSSGRYDSANEVIRDALRALEAREAKLATLIAHLEEGITDSDAAAFEDLSIEQLIEELDAELELGVEPALKH